MYNVSPTLVRLQFEIDDKVTLFLRSNLTKQRRLGILLGRFPSGFRV